MHPQANWPHGEATRASRFAPPHHLPPCRYVGRSEADQGDRSLSHMTRGCIIGGTALVDSTINQKPYPNTVKFTKHAKYLEWQTDELRVVMKEDKSVEAAVLSMLYLDLVRVRARVRVRVNAGVCSFSLQSPLRSQ